MDNKIITVENKIINFETIRARHERVLEDIENILSGYQAILGDRKQNVTYTSVPVSTGKHLYEALKKYKYRSKDELKQKNINAYNIEVRDLNVQSAKDFASELRNKGKIVINPGDFKEQNWQDTLYMCYWEQVIEKFISEIHFNNDYHYSTGCVEELFIGIDKNKGLYHRSGKPLIVSEEIPKLWKAAEDITNVCDEEPKNLVNFIMKIELHYRNGNKRA